MTRRRAAGGLVLLALLLGVPAPARAQSTELRQLKLIRLPDPDQTRSGAVAFDGRYIFYTEWDDQADTATIHRLDPKTGRRASSFDIDVPGLWGMTYDGRRNYLYAIGGSSSAANGSGGSTTMYQVDLADLKVTELFEIPSELSTWPHWSYDAGIDGFRASGEGYTAPVPGSGNCGILDNCSNTGTAIATFDRDGTKVDQCTVTDRDGQGADLFFSTLVAAGDGSVYVQSEDDSTLYHVSKDCVKVGEGVHPHYAESAENDSMACDTVTFPVPAVWIRDGAADAIVAFEVPGGYCPLPTKMAPVVGKDVMVGTPVKVCTRLSLANVSITLVGQPVTLTVNGKKLATVPTDAKGGACTTYVPQKAGKHKLAASFAGSRAYMPSSNVGLMKAIPQPVQNSPRRPPGIAIDTPPQQPPQLAPKPAPVTQLQLQPGTQTQVQPHVQSQVQVQAGIVPQIQEQVQVARSTVDKKQRDLSMSRYRARRRAPMSPLPLAAGAAAIVGMALVVRPARETAASHNR